MALSCAMDAWAVRPDEQLNHRSELSFDQDAFYASLLKDGVSPAAAKVLTQQHLLLIAQGRAPAVAA